jgi:hypothetical protein
MKPEPGRLLACPVVGDDLDRHGAGNGIEQREHAPLEEIPRREQLHAPLRTLKHFCKAGLDVLFAVNGPDKFLVAPAFRPLLAVEGVEGRPGTLGVALYPAHQVLDALVGRNRGEAFGCRVRDADQFLLDEPVENRVDGCARHARDLVNFRCGRARRPEKPDIHKGFVLGKSQ